ncbi:MAG: class I lanthipeptide [Bacteroidota bacterium]|jgi:hypothetical protein
MKKVTFNSLDLDPETLSQLSEDQAEQIEGGKTIGSCNIVSCFAAAEDEAAAAE